MTDEQSLVYWKAEGRENGKARTQGGADLDKYRALYEQTKVAG